MAVLLASIPASTEEPAAIGFATPEDHPVTAELVAEHASIQPGGRTRIGVHFEIEEGWHIYADPPGDAGLPTKITWTAPRGVLLGPIRWPKPERFVDPGDIRTSGYSGLVVPYSTVTLPTRQFDGGAVVLRAQASWLACHDICVPGKTDLSLTLPVSMQPPVASAHAEFFDHN